MIARQAVAILALSLAATSLCHARVWTDNTGQRQVEAEYAGFKNRRVLLQLASGKSVQVPWARLSKVDQQYVRKQITGGGGQPLQAKTMSRDEAVIFYRQLGGAVNALEDGRVISVILDHTKVTNADLIHLKELPGLRWIGLHNTGITDAGMIHLKTLTTLEGLILLGTRVTDTGLVNVKGLTNLRELNLNGTEVTDAGLVHLIGLTKLKQLGLGVTKITDAGLPQLRGLQDLMILTVSWTKVTDAGVKSLQIALPKCKIN